MRQLTKPEAIDMRIDLPFQYKVNGIEKGRRNPADYDGYDIVGIEVPDVDQGDVVRALELLDKDGIPSETFVFYRDNFYIRNFRTDEMAFGPQHQMLIGRWPQKSYTRPQVRGVYRDTTYTSKEASDDNLRATKGLGLVGLLTRKTINSSYSWVLDKDHNFFAPLSLVDGVVCIPPVDPRERLREVRQNNMLAAREGAIKHALDNVIAIDGEVYHKVSEPVIVANKHRVDWVFSQTLEPLNTQYNVYNNGDDTWTKDAFRMSMADFDDVAELYPEASSRMGFYIEHIEPSCFPARDTRKGMVRDVEDALYMRHRLGDQKTAFIHQWCMLRDLMAETPGKTVAEKDDVVLDRAAEIMFAMQDILEAEKFPGARLWAERDVGMAMLDIPDTFDGP
jgi:hypothetical protein